MRNNLLLLYTCRKVTFGEQLLGENLDWCEDK